MNHHESSRAQQHSNWNSVSTSRSSTGTCRVSLHVIALWTHQKFESFKNISQRRNSDPNLLINSKKFLEIVRIGFRWNGVSFPNLPSPISSQPRKIADNTFLPDWWIIAWSFGGDGWYSTIAPKWILGPFEWFSKSFLYGVFPSARRPLNISQIVDVHRTGPPPFIQSWL